VPVPQSHQIYYPPSLSPTHQIYGNVISPTGFSNFGYSATGWHGSSDYGLFQSTYHYQPTEYIPIISETRWDIIKDEKWIFIHLKLF
jgi:brachyury protein